MPIGRPRVWNNEERLDRKRAAHERWKAANTEKYEEQKRRLQRLCMRKRRAEETAEKS